MFQKAPTPLAPTDPTVASQSTESSSGYADKRGQIARMISEKMIGRCTVIFDSECDAAWNVQQHSLQRRLAPTNSEKAKADFLESSCKVDPLFQYEHEIEPHQLERFPVCKRWLLEAEKLLDSVVKEFGSESGFLKASTRRRKAQAAAETGRVDGAGPTMAPMTAEELVQSAEAFLRDCIVSGGAEATDALVQRLTIHFSHRKTRSMSVKGCVLNVPLPITLTKVRANSMWWHELGTHFLRNAINEPQRGRTGSSRNRAPSHVPFGAKGGVTGHLARIAQGRDEERDKQKAKKKGKQVKVKTVSIAKGCQMVVVNKATVRVGRSLDSQEAPCGRLEVGEIVDVLEVVNPASQLPCPYVCTKRAVLRETHDFDSEITGHVEEGEGITALEERQWEGRRRIRCKSGWLSVTSADGESVFFTCTASQPRFSFERGGGIYWVSMAATEGRQLLVPLETVGSGAAGGAEGTKGERVSAHLREKEEHTSEEGTAIVNQYMAEADYRMWRPALMYVAAAKAWELGFVGLWEYLGRWVHSDERKWNICSRVKGGLRDTSRLGGFCRDQAYWAGAVRVLRGRHKIDFGLLHSGRINIDEAMTGDGEGPEVEPLEGAVLPPFLGDLDQYRRQLDQIAAANFLS